MFNDQVEVFKKKSIELVIDDGPNRPPNRVSRAVLSAKSEGDETSSSSSSDETIRRRKDAKEAGKPKPTMNEDISEKSNESYDSSEREFMKKRSIVSSSVLSISSFSSSDEDSDRVRRQLIKKYTSTMLQWDSLTLSDKLAIFETWYIVAFLGDLCIIFGTIFFYGSNIFNLAITELIIGIGAFCIWISIVKYFKNTPQHYTILRTMMLASP